MHPASHTFQYPKVTPVAPSAPGAAKPSAAVVAAPAPAGPSTAGRPQR